MIRVILSIGRTSLFPG